MNRSVPKPSTRGVVITAVAILVVVALAVHYLVLLPRRVEWKLAITTGSVQGVFTLNELKAVSEAVDLPGVGRVKAVPLSKLLLLSGVDLNTTLVYRIHASGADGYSRSIERAFLYLPGTYVILAEGQEADWGPLRLAVKGLSSKYWVKMLVRVDVETKQWGLVLLVNNETAAFLELSDLLGAAVNLEGVGLTVPLSQLLAEHGIDVENVEVVELVGSDGYRCVLHPSAISDIHVMLVPDALVRELGPLRAVVRGRPKSTWVRHLVAIHLVTRG